jgi:ribosomal 50S subunit-recycling heat shock protein
MRLDLYLKRCCLVRRRADAKRACENGIVSVDDQPGKPGRMVRPGQRVEVRFVDRHLQIEVIDLPLRNVSRAAARDYYRVLRDEAIDVTDF